MYILCEMKSPSMTILFVKENNSLFNRLKGCSSAFIYNVYRSTLILAGIVALSACGTDNGSQEVLDSAEAMLGRGEVKEAMITVDGIFKSNDTASLNWKDYCRAFVIYSVAYDSSIESDHALERSERCLVSARRLNNDSTEAFFRETAEHRAEIEKITNILQTLQEARQLDPEVFNTDHDIDPADPEHNHHHEDGAEEGHEG